MSWTAERLTNRRTALKLLSLPSVTAVFADTDQQDAIGRGRRLIEEKMVRDSLPGLSVAVMRDDRLVWSEGFGYANLEHKVAASPLTKFRVASVSKSLTSAAVALLYQKGKLDLDAPVQVYVPSFPKKQYPITTRQLAGHLSGIPQYDDDDIINRTHYSSMLEALKKFQDRPLLFPPGERFHYSSFGWNLIGAAIEGASGRPFLDFMQESVFGPLDMRHTVADRYERIIEKRTSFYQLAANGAVENAPAVDNSDLWPGGGFLSTAEDLVRFGSAISNRRLLERKTVAMLFSSMHTNDQKPTGYGLGWRIESFDRFQFVGHRGEHIGARAQLMVFPERNLTLAVLLNCNCTGYWELAQRLAKLFLK